MNKIIILLLGVTLMKSVYAQDTESKITIEASDLNVKINKNIYGHFAEHLGHGIYQGIWVGEKSHIPNTHGIRNDVVKALKQIKVPVLRWPGGCFAEEYHWQDGIGPRNKRPTRINAIWGGVIEDNSFGTHEFMELCQLIGCEPYLAANVGSGTVQELEQWVEYMNSDSNSTIAQLRKKNGREKSWGVKYWGLGNENWGAGGNMLPEYYANLVRRYAAYCHDYGQNKVFKIACGSGGEDYNWTEVVMKNAGNYFDGISYHNYSFGDGKIATDFDERGWFDIIKKSLKMDEYLTKYSTIMDKYDANKRVALIVDEWGTWYQAEPNSNSAFLYQQNTLRDAITAACNLNIFNNHSDRVRMANLAQTVNVLQAVILTQDEKMVLTPTYHVFDMFKVHQDALLIPLKIECQDYGFENDTLPAVNGSASVDISGKMHISLCNINPHAAETITCVFNHYAVKSVTGTVLTADAMTAHNTFDSPNVVVPKPFSAFKINQKNVEVILPAKSVIVLALDGKYDLPPTVELKHPVAGVNYQYYEGAWNKLPEFDTLAPLKTGVINQFLFPENSAEVNFGLQYTGYIKIPTDGMYTFYSNSDDGSCVYIDNKLIIENDGDHPPIERSGMVLLKEGYHEIKVTFYQAQGGKALDVSIEGPGLMKQIISKAMLFHGK
jgi:alpha-L-arabinofuranosidase